MTIALKELGFKPSKVTKIINAGRFLQAYNWFEEGRCYFGLKNDMTARDFIDKLSEYFGGFGVGSLDVLSRMRKQGRKKAHRHFVKKGIRMSQKALEDLQREYPINLHERRGRKSASSGLHQTHSTHQVATHESLVVLEDAYNEPSIEQPESGQRLIKQFFQLFVSGEIEHRLDEFTPAAQAHLIDEINEGIHLLEEFVAKYKTIEVTHVH